MLEIRVADIASEAYKKFKQWILGEWKEVQQLPDAADASNIPLPLLSFEESTLAGGLTFIKYKNPENIEDALWINTVFVHEDYRGNGIAQALIGRAEQVCLDNGYTTFYVYTDKPSLYLKLGWSVLEQDGENYVLFKQLGKAMCQTI